MSRIFRSLLGVVVVLPAPVAVTVDGCAVGYAWRQLDVSVHQAALSIKNTGTETLKGWTLRFTLPASQKILMVKGASLESPSGSVVAHDIVVNAVVEPGGTVAVSYQATGAGGLASDFSVNGLPCT
ncbi:hypothetical protein Q0Z83_109590 [Actinoplanes sichuanensis]|uniref:Cellulose binding domain-containing protein n=1 Tax=Actinoplanes sichuanensis TaxID=512349 RepID=A0ABW4A3M2_9ACTN|nr:cellulose binding domain-containing protein [Actinoplanes sichuanensis]BEL12768.1 hypothetical protein Q0Z83_109590 [Actinoplanes sichuanensis]